MSIDKIKLHNNKLSDELYTFQYSVEFFIKYSNIDHNDIILCPFSLKWSAFVKILRQHGFNVIYTGDINFFNLDKTFIDENKITCIIDNPPFTIKDEVLKKSIELEVPFAYIMPIDVLGGVKRHKLFKRMILQVLIPNKRLKFITPKNKSLLNNPATFHSIFISNGLLKNNIILADINEYEDFL